MRSVARRFVLCGFLGGLALALCLSQPAFAQIKPAAAPEKMILALGTGAFFFTLHYVAAGAGLFAEQGVEVETIDLTTGPRQTAAVMGGSVDATLMGLQLVIQANMRGGDVVALSQIYSIMPISLTLSNNAIARTGISASMPIDERVKRLKGLRIGVTTPGAGSDDVLQSLLKTRGMDPQKDVVIQPLGGGDAMLAAMERGATDGFMNTSPIPEIAAQRNVGRIVVEPLNGDVPELRDVPYIIFATSRETLAKKRPALLSMMRAYAQAMVFVREHPAKASEIVHKVFPDLDKAVFDVSFAKYATGLPKSSPIVPQQVEKTVAWMNVAKKTPIAGKYEDVVEPSLARQLEETPPK
jgi:NitT/TauT family transport system substrate-binding protein